MDSDNIFDARGMLRSDLENVDVAPERRPQFEALVIAVREAEAAEADIITKERAVAVREDERAAAAAALPEYTFLDEWRKARFAGRPR